MRDQVVKYLRAVFPPGSKGYFAVCSSEPERKSASKGMLSKHFLCEAGIEAAADYILAEDDAGRNTYVTLTAHGNDPGPYKRGTRAEKVCAGVLWADIDRRGPGHVATDLPETTADLVALLKKIDFEPSFLVDTGGGWHAYWRLSTPLALDAAGGKQRDEFQELMRSLQRRLGDAAKVFGWHFDNTSDLTRVLRPAGTHNHKPGRAAPPLVEFLIDPDEGTSYDYRLFSRAFEVKEDKIAALFGGAPTVAPGVGAEVGRGDADDDVEPETVAPAAAAGIEWDGEKTIAEIRDKVSRSRHPERTETLKAFLEGRAWAKLGERDAMAQRLVSWLAFFTGGQGNVDAILELAAPSLAVMDAEKPPVTEAWFAEKLVRALNDARRISAGMRQQDQRMSERMFASARGRFEETARAALGQALPKGAPGSEPAQIPLGAPNSSTVKAQSGVMNPIEAAGERQPPGVMTPVSSNPTAPESPTANGGADVETFMSGSAALALAPAPDAGGDETALTYYTRFELEAAAADQGALSGVVCDLVDLKQRLIIQKGETFFHLKRCADELWRYGEPLQRGELDVAIPEDFKLLPEQLPLPGKEDDGEPFFAWHAAKADGTLRRKTQKEILGELCTVARGEVVYDLRIPRSYLDPRAQTFYVAACPVRPSLTPQYDEMVDRWLRTFGENEADRDKWLDFCATLTDLRYPTCGVFLSGPPDTGKTMFATGAARLWADDFTNMDDVFASSGFNSGLASCPLIVADEALPTDSSGRTVSTKLLRRLIGSDRRALRRKFMANATIVGAVRCLFLANNEDMIGQGDESLGADALEAVAGRFLHIRVTRAAHDFLVSIGGRGGIPGGTGPAAEGTRGWVDENKIARHLLWLRDNRAVKYGHRFIVDGHESKVSQLLATNGVIPGLVCEWLARFLAKPIETRLRNRHVVLGGGKYWVNGQAVLDAWADLIKSDRAAPTLGKINKALGGVSFPRTDGDAGAHRHYVNGKRIRYWEIRPEIILEYAEANQIGDDMDAMRTRIEGPEREFTGTSVSAAFGHDKGKGGAK